MESANVDLQQVEALIQTGTVFDGLPHKLPAGLQGLKVWLSPSRLPGSEYPVMYCLGPSPHTVSGVWHRPISSSARLMSYSPS